MSTTIRLEPRHEGPPGSGQGGWASWRFADAIGEPVTIALRAPVPLETDLEIEESGQGTWHLIDNSFASPVTVLEASRWEPSFASTQAVPLDAAAEARTRFEFTDHDHPAAGCFSCGIGPDTMHVHAGSLSDGRYATDWTAPEWAAVDGVVQPGVLWAAMDCTAAWYVCSTAEEKMAFTVQYAAEVTAPIQPGGRYSVVGWSGDFPAEWDGRKRGAASAAFDEHGNCVGRARSFWVSAR